MSAANQVFPSEVDEHRSFFDRFATRINTIVSRAPFFSFCVLLVLIWLPSILVVPSQIPKKVDTWQLVINTATTIITFLMVSLAANTSSRADAASQHKLNAIAKALADFMEEQERDDLHDAVHELRAAVGLENRESA